MKVPTGGYGDKNEIHPPSPSNNFSYKVVFYCMIAFIVIVATLAIINANKTDCVRIHDTETISTLET